MIFFHRKQIENLKKIYLSGKIPHAFLFVGEEGLGKKEVALEFASWILKTKKLTSHPDFILLEPQKDEIKIDQIRELKERLSLKAVTAPLKVAILDKAEKMTISAQNCFLKTLEEAKSSILILIAKNEKLLLPTIASRCEKIKFFLPKKEDLENYLKEKGIEKEKLQKILEFSQGKPKKAMELLENKQKLEKIETLSKILDKISQLSLFERFQLVKWMLENFTFFEALELLIQKKRKELIKEEKFENLKILKELQKIYYYSFNYKLDKKLTLENIFLKL